MKANVFNNNILAGVLEKKLDGTYSFEYDDAYMQINKYASISLSLPKSIKVHTSRTMFSFFFGLLTEGVNKDIQCRLLKIDENDYFKRLMLTAQNDTIGAITVKPTND